jgi:beta-lactam-binding protein with PASTA domain
MPDLRGLTPREALLRLGELDLALGRRVKAQGEPGVIVATDPGLGQLVRPGTEVTVFIGAGPTADERALTSF